MPRPLEPLGPDGIEPLSADAVSTRGGLRRRSATTSAADARDGVRAQLDVRPLPELLPALRARLVRSDDDHLGSDNRTCAFRVVGEGPSFRVENRVPGADANPYLAFSATIAAGLHGIDGKLDAGEPYAGNAYTSDRPHLPASMEESVDAFSTSAVAREAFGDEVFTHLLQVARHEQQAFDRYLYETETDPNGGVTDWELRRYFERG